MVKREKKISKEVRGSGKMGGERDWKVDGGWEGEGGEG